MQAAEHIAVMQHTIAYMRAVWIFPSAQEVDSPRKYYLKAAILCSSTFLFSVGGLLHIIVNYIRKTYVSLGVDLSSIFSMMGCYMYHVFYMSNIKNTIKIYKKLSDFRSFGKPDTFEETNKKLNKLSDIHIIILFSLVVSVGVTPWMVYGHCVETNVGKDRDELCGLIVGTWLPYNLMGTACRYLVYIYQVYAAFAMYFTSEMINYILGETMEHIIVRFQHVRSKFFEAFGEKDPSIQRKKFNRAVEYHVAVIELVKMVNKSYSSSIFVHALLIGAVIGCSGQGLAQDFSFGPVPLIMGWVTLVIITCTCGQRLMNEGSDFAEAIYNLDWVGADKQIQKDLIMVLLRCQVPITLQAKPLGAMNFSMIVAILNTAYTYLTLLRQSK